MFGRCRMFALALVLTDIPNYFSSRSWNLFFTLTHAEFASLTKLWFDTLFFPNTLQLILLERVNKRITCCFMNNKRHGKCFFGENTILSVETVNIQPSKPKTIQDIIPSTHQFFNVFCAMKGLTFGGMSATIKCIDNFCFKSSFSNAQHFLQLWRLDRKSVV